MTTQSLPPDPDVDLDVVAHLTVEVRPAHRASRWAWHLVDGRDGSDVEHGFEYDSPTDARWAGLTRLAELTPSLAGSQAIARLLVDVSRVDPLPTTYLRKRSA